MVFLGDSLVEALPGTMLCANRGIAYDHISAGGIDVLSRLTPDKLAADPSHIFLLVGINDLADMPERGDVVLERYETLLAELRRLYSSAALTCVSLLPTRDGYRQLNEMVVRFNRTLHELTERFGSAYVDAHSALCDENGELATPYSRDGLHLSPRGYQALTRILKAAAPEVWGTPRPSAHLLAAAGSALRQARHSLRAAGRTSTATDREGKAASDDGEYHSPTDVLGLEAPLEFLRAWLRTGDSAYESLYRGTCVSELTARPKGSAADWPARTGTLLGLVDQRHGLSDAAWTKLKRFLDDVHVSMPSQPDALKEVRILFVGDCVFEEVVLFLSAECARKGLLLRAEHIVSKNPLEQRRQVKALDARRYMAVFYSPFTYAFDQDYARLLEPSRMRRSAAETSEVVQHAFETTSRTLDVLADAFECPVFVSNASTIQRGTTPLRRAVKATLTRRTRTLVRAQINARLAAYLGRANDATHRHLFLVDEAALIRNEADHRELGAYLHTSRALHPTRFSQRLAEEIAIQIEATALRSRKLIICDLDNTLWEGVIGEGLGVTQHLDRQEVLKRLKAKGVILAIASKNSPDKITWDGAALDQTSFVASEVSWGPKVQGIQRIYASLNIKPKDGVFIDDRSDERQMVQERWPAMHVADPCDQRTWRVFARWADLLDDDQEFDRTAMYQQREQRDAAISSAQAAEDAEHAAEMFARLGLKATLSRADKGALKRVAELINRTNQWNLAATRTTFGEVEKWHASSEYHIYTVSVDDQFGAMGTVCVAVARETADRLEIPVFVLSCRVFGFGVETLLLEHLTRLSERRYGAAQVRGFFTATEHNAPCKDMYPEHGFTQMDDGWKYVAESTAKPRPTWFALKGFEF